MKAWARRTRMRNRSSLSAAIRCRSAWRDHVARDLTVIVTPTDTTLKVTADERLIVDVPRTTVRAITGSKSTNPNRRVSRFLRQVFRDSLSRPLLIDLVVVC
jgi:hypothetical protein